MTSAYPPPWNLSFPNSEMEIIVLLQNVAARMNQIIYVKVPGMVLRHPGHRVANYGVESSALLFVSSNFLTN